MNTYSLNVPKDRLSPGRIILVNKKPYKVMAWNHWSNTWQISDHTGKITPNPSEFFEDQFTNNIMGE
jgi:hypothetical protein